MCACEELSLYVGNDRCARRCRGVGFCRVERYRYSDRDCSHGARWALDSFHSKPLPPETRLLRFKTHGQSTLKDPTMTTCQSLPRGTPPDREWVSGLRSKYSEQGTTVLIDAMLLPECDPELSYYRQELKGITDNSIGSLPMSDYYGGGRHVNPIGSVPLSNMIADQILGHLHSDLNAGAR